MINKNGMSYMEFLVGVTTFNIQNSVLVDRWLNMFILKVHKIEIFFGFDFEICIISLLFMSNIKILQ